ncbi:hypothetical protein chiPu_0032652, partial [Chiloscyllium punctatum]|nr:hypothetical protein [Chiloscyllium punctatum]
MCGNRAKFWNAMPMPRRSGGAPTTERPPIRMSPSSGSNMPAIIRSSTVLPLPDGPNTATISPGSTASDNPSAGRATPNALLTALISRRAIGSAFHRAEREPLDQIALRIERQQQGRRHREHDRRRDLTVLDSGRGDEGERADGHRLLVGGSQDQGEHEIVPAEDERQQPRRGDSRPCQRHRD